MKKVVISGATGFIGSNLCKKLLDMDYEVIGIGHKVNYRIEKINNKNFKFLEIDNIDFDILKNADIYYHLAWNMNFANTKDNTQAINVEMSNLSTTTNLVNNMINVGVKKVVFCGSVAQEKYFYKDESSLTNIKGSIYGIVKNAANEICKKMAYDAKVSYNHAILTHTFGPDDLKTICFFIKKIAMNEPLDLIQESDLADWNYITDTVNALVAIGEKGINMKDYYVGHRNIKTFGENIKSVKKILNSSSHIEFGKYEETKGTDYSKINLDALYNDTGFECSYDFKKAVLETTEWLKKEGHLNE